MKIAFFAYGCQPLYANILDDRPLGGVETAAVRLAKALDDLGHEVTVITSGNNPPPSKPAYVSYAQCGALGPFDVVIYIRQWMDAFFDPPQGKRRMLWTGDDFRQASTFGLGDRRVVQRFDRFLFVSDWQARTMCEASGMPYEKTWILRNGVDLSLFQGEETKVRKRLIYSSIPYRGLGFLTQLFPPILSRHPDAELHIFSGYDVYSAPNESEFNLRELQAMKEAFAKIPNTHFHGNVKQTQLAREMMRSAVCAYPNIFDETSCISVMEAMAGGCAVVTSAKAALPETVADAGFLIAGEPGTPAYNSAFVQAVDRVLSNDELFEKLSAAGKARVAAELNWTAQAKRLSDFLETA